MSGRVLPDHPERRRILVRSALRLLGIALGMLLLYALVPVPGTSGAAALLGMVVGLLFFVVLVGWQLQTIVRAEHPVLRAAEVIVFAVPMLVVIFAFTFLTISRADPQSFSEPLGRVDALYFTVSTVATVGFGDITPTSAGARMVVTFQMLFDLALLAGLVRLVVLATRTGLRRQEAETGA
ncbi:MAG TPA: potassium channel family protein [Solirubrobacterales bacterium]|nr:potassium channel family protein [Solirubrobacterales bacterium]